MSGTNAIETHINDPLQYLAPLPHVGRFYPYGFPVEIASNMREVIDAAHESFGAYSRRYDTPPIRLHVLVGEAGSGTPPPPVLRGQRNMLAWVSDAGNFAMCDRLQRFGYSCVTRATVEDRIFFRWHFVDAIIYVLLELNYTTSLHAACVALDGAGVLLYGESGVGKSSLAYACARRGWTYVSDDASSVLWDGGRIVIGEPHHFRFRAEAPDLFPELRGLTVGRQLDHKPTIEVYTIDLPIRTAPECRVERIVFLERQPGSSPRVTRVSREETLERFAQDMAKFDPELEPRRKQAIEAVAEAPAYHMRYSSFEEAVPLLERIARGGEPPC